MCRENTQNPPPVINLMFKYEGQLNLPGVENDRHRIQEINRRLYGSEGTLFHDDFFKPSSDQTDTLQRQPIDSPEGINNFLELKKEAFLLELQKSIEGNDNRPVLNYSGHGTRCIDDNNRIIWCIMLPIPSQILRKKLIDSNACQENEFYSLKLCPRFW